MFAFRDQHADRRIAVDMVEDLRHGQELADGGAALDRQRGEIGAQGLHFGQFVAQPGERAAAAEIEIAMRVDHPADGVVKLAGVHPEMNPAHAQPVRAHRRGECLEGDGALGRGGLRLVLQCIDQRGQAQQLGRIVRRQAIGHGGQRLGIVEIAREIGRTVPRISGRRMQRFEQWVRRIDRLQRGAVSRQPLGLFREAEADAVVPADVGPPVHVVADPGGEAERQRLEAAPVLWPTGFRLG